MAKRGNSGKQTNPGNSTATTADRVSTPDPMEQRVVAFAEQLGRIVGTVQARAEGWMDRDALSSQMTSVRDGAADLIEQLKATVTNATGSKAPEANTQAPSKSGGKTGAAKTGAPAAVARTKGRSGGAVDAPGKKHRKPLPSDPRAIAADAKRSNRQAGKSGMKTMKRRGRG